MRLSIPTARRAQAGRLLIAAAMLSCTVRADTFTGSTWAVHFNRPDQTTSASSIGPDEFLLRDVWLARIHALQAGDYGALSTYTFSGNSAACGAAGPILQALSQALDRGAQIAFAVDASVNTASNFWPGISLDSLARRKQNPLRLAQPPKGGIMHNKLGVFYFHSSRQAWTLSGSWNFTGGASSQQWNILTEILNPALASACSNEFNQFLAGHFHADPLKSHAHDASPFSLPDSSRPAWIRFAPYPDAKTGGNNALTDITNAIAHASDEIFFALNKCTRLAVARELVAAANRGVIVHGTIPKSDRAWPGADSYEVWQFLANPANYSSPNRVRLYDAYYNAARSRPDANNRDLTHTKYMILDPRGTNPLVIHGSANWTASALSLTSSNDENLQFLPHPGIALAFLAHFDAMTDGFRPWCALIPSPASPSSTRLWLDYWLPHAAPCLLEATPSLTPAPQTWHPLTNLPPLRGTHRIPLPDTSNSPPSPHFFRLRLPN